MAFNLLGESQPAIQPGRASYQQPATLRFSFLTCGAILGRSGHRLVLHISLAWGGLIPTSVCK